MNSTVRLRVFLGTLLPMALLLVGAHVYIADALDQFMTARAQEDLQVRLGLLVREVSQAEPEDWDALADALGRTALGRVTIVAADGVVLGDSTLDQAALGRAENHGDRPEVTSAQGGGPGVATRFSSTLQQRMLYVAQPFTTPQGRSGVVRLAQSLSDVDEGINRLRQLLYTALAVTLLLAVALSTLSAQWASASARTLTRIARKLAGGDLDARAPGEGRDEFAHLGRALNTLAQSLSTTLAELKEERDLLGEILTGMQEGVLWVDADGKVQLINPAMRTMLHLGPDAVGQTLRQVASSPTLEELLHHIESGTSGTVELEISDPVRRRVMIRATPLTGRGDGVLAVCVDVTDLRRLESVRRDFVANASHELRTPVASIRAAAEMLAPSMSADPEAARRFVDIIERNADRLQRLVADLLDLSRMESGSFKVELEDVDLPQLITHSLSLFRQRAGQKRITLVGDVGAGLPRARGDTRALEQVITNLVDNAIQYCPEGSNVRLDARVEDGRMALIVEDNGPGIDARHLPRLFERFYRVDKGRSREQGGTGLGLAIVKHLVEVMDGDVEVMSSVGKGSRFTVTIPLA